MDGWTAAVSRRTQNLGMSAHLCGAVAVEIGREVEASLRLGTKSCRS